LDHTDRFILLDNPINQTILVTFMKKKKIKYDVAKNGLEAVQKWKTGGFHLILVSPSYPCPQHLDPDERVA
jgi:osomolarity two-component system response regulator SSK1